MMGVKDMPDDARVWIYQSAEELTSDKEQEILKRLEGFIPSWTAHGKDLKAAAEILYHRFIVIAVDEQQAQASGCSVDKSVKFIQQLENDLQLSLLDRMVITYKDHGNVVSCKMSDSNRLIEEGKINENTTVFNNMVTTKSAFDNDWEVPVVKSWHKQLLN